MREQDFAVQILVQFGILEITCSGFIDSARIGAVVDDDRTVFKFCTLNALFPGQCRAEFSSRSIPTESFFSMVKGYSSLLRCVSGTCGAILPVYSKP